MTKSILPNIVVVAGPTASGKSALALSLAEKLGGVIINADSQQMYRELRILTARPAPEEEVRAPHKLYGTLSAADNCSAGHWLKLARMEIDWARGEGKAPIVVGGTGLYLKALLQGIADLPDIPESVRAQARSDYEQMGKEAYAERLRWVDPQFFTRFKVHDRQRLIRAYEVWLGTGKPLSWWQNQKVMAPYAADQLKVYRTDIDREELYARCNARFVKMVEEGATEEVRQLLALNLPNDLPAMKSVGVKELTAYIKGEITIDQAIEKAQQATRNYAKRQLTWFRHQLTSATRVITGEELSKKLHFAFDSGEGKVMDL